MSHNPRVLVAAHPTRGVDVGAQAAIWEHLRNARANGLAVLLISADLFVCGLVTLIQAWGATQWFGIKLPVMMGVTFAAVAPMVAMANANPGVAGAGAMRQMFVNIFPNCLAPLIVQASLGFSNAILDMAALGFLGMGAQPPTPEWGTMLSDVLQFAQSAWWVVTFPGLAILLTVLAFNLMGDGLRDALDPKLKQ